MHTQIARVALAAVITLSASATTGCASAQSRLIMGAQEAETPEVKSSNLRELSLSERQALAETLTGEIQTVYPSDAGLARAYGQVANLGTESYERVRFDIVARISGGSEAGESMKSVGTFEIQGGLTPGDIKPFDVQTTASMGDVKNLVVMVSALP